MAYDCMWYRVASRHAIVCCLSVHFRVLWCDPSRLQAGVQLVATAHGHNLFDLQASHWEVWRHLSICRYYGMPRELALALGFITIHWTINSDRLRSRGRSIVYPSAKASKHRVARFSWRHHNDNSGRCHGLRHVPTSYRVQPFSLLQVSWSVASSFLGDSFQFSAACLVLVWHRRLPGE